MNVQHDITDFRLNTFEKYVFNLLTPGMQRFLLKLAHTVWAEKYNEICQLLNQSYDGATRNAEALNKAYADLQTKSLLIGSAAIDLKNMVDSLRDEHWVDPVVIDRIEEIIKKTS